MAESVLIQRLLEEEYEFEEPWKSPKGTGFVLPIIGKEPFIERNYVLLEEVKDEVDLQDTGEIGGVNFTNRSGKTVYVRKGAMLKGQGTQSRSPISSVVLEPEVITVKVPVNCIHASHGINTRGYFVAGAAVPHEVEKSLGNQSSTWNSISSLSMATRIPHADAAHGDSPHSHSSVYRQGNGFPAISLSGQASGDGAHHVLVGGLPLQADNLVGWSDAMESITGTVDDVLKDIPGDYLNQLGIAVFDLNGVVGVELFNHPDSWKAYSESIIRSYAKTLSEGSELYEIKTDKAEVVLMDFLGTFLESEKEQISSNSVSKVWALKTEGGFGELTEVQGREVHLALAKQDETDQPQPPRNRGTFLTHNSNDDTTPTNISNWSTRKGAYTLLHNLDEKPQRFTELLNNMDVSRGTLSNRLNEAKKMKLVNRAIRKENGGAVYTLTGKGSVVKRRIETHIVGS